MKNESTTLLEICCGCLEDALVADKTGADRIELFSGKRGSIPSSHRLRAGYGTCLGL